MALTAIKWVSYTVSFLLELCALVAFGFWGATWGQGTVAKIALAVGAPLAMAIVWGLFAAPRASVRLSAPAVLAVKALVFGCASVGLALTGRRELGVALFVAFVASEALVHFIDS